MFKTLVNLIPVLAFFFHGMALAGGYSTDKDHVALNGYDVVSYHTQAEAVRGSAQYAAVHEGATFYFRSAENKQMFDAAPDKYLPQFDGYCAFAVAMKKAKVPADPKTFKFRDGKLYLFFNDYFEGKPFNTMVPWNQDEKKLVRQAEDNWKSIR